MGKGEAEAVEQDGLGWVWFGDLAEADGFLGAVGGFCRQDDVAAFDLRDLVQQRARRGAETRSVHPAGECFPQCIREEADQDVSLHAVFFLMPDRANSSSSLVMRKAHSASVS